jgi:hypothetical protein
MTSKNSKRFDDVRPGEALPELVIPITTLLVASGAIATRDYFPGHHDLEAARELGSPHVFMNILTTSGLAQRYVEGWAGAGARFKGLKIKLGAPNDEVAQIAAFVTKLASVSDADYKSWTTPQ